MSTESRRTREEGNVDGVPSHPGGGECRRTREEDFDISTHTPSCRIPSLPFYLFTFSQRKNLFERIGQLEVQPLVSHGMRQFQAISVQT